jgi:hypothetical protein
MWNKHRLAIEKGLSVTAGYAEPEASPLRKTKTAEVTRFGNSRAARIFHVQRNRPAGALSTARITPGIPRWTDVVPSRRHPCGGKRTDLHGMTCSTPW